MKKAKLTIGVLALGFLSLGIMSCKETKKDSSQTEASVSRQEKSQRASNGVGLIIDNYLELKDALVADNQELAGKAGEELGNNLSKFDTESWEASSLTELKTIIASAKENSAQIAKGDIAQQREYFEGLSANLVSLIGITGTPSTLYQQFCPMYNNDKGGMWLSAVKAVKNPYFGSGMLNCGFVQKEIN